MKESNLISKLSVSATLAMSQKSNEMRQQGIDIINLSIGEPDFNTPNHVKEAAKKAIDENITHYSPVPGFLNLREAVCDKFKNENNLHFEPNQIVVSNGAKQALANVFMCSLNEGDEVIIPIPYWVSYSELVTLSGGTNVFVDSSIKNDFKITPEQLENAITSKTKIFLLNSPSNPSGSLYSKEELLGLVKVLAKYEDILIVSDEIYEHINFVGHHESIAQFEEIKDRTVVINGVSKGYAMTGWRIGYIGAPLWLAKSCSKLQGQTTAGANSIAQMASIAALKIKSDCIVKMRSTFVERRDILVKLLKEIPGLIVNKPSGAFYVFPDIRSFFGKKHNDTIINNASELAIFLLEDANIATVTGEAFGAPSYIRLSYATSTDKLIEAVKRMKISLSKLK